MPNDRSDSYRNALLDAKNKDPQLIMCILPTQRRDLYSLIKKLCCVQYAIPTQVMVLKTITPKQGMNRNTNHTNPLLTVGTKVAIQINSKLGGAPWMVDIPPTGLMVVGFDVCHDTVSKKKSFGAMVATMDMKSNHNYFSAVSQHETGVELSNDFASNIIKALNEYKKQHGSLPVRILIYRDGVGEGQINHVYEHEIEEIRAKLKIAYGHERYKLTFIVVSKRINTRFFVGGSNPSPGTVVDSVVTLPER